MDKIVVHDLRRITKNKHNSAPLLACTTTHIVKGDVIITGQLILEIPASGVGHSAADEATSAAKNLSESKSVRPRPQGTRTVPRGGKSYNRVPRATQHKNGAGNAPTLMTRDDSGGTRENGVRCGHTCGCMCVPTHLCCTAFRTVHVTLIHTYKSPHFAYKKHMVCVLGSRVIPARPTPSTRGRRVPQKLTITTILHGKHLRLAGNWSMYSIDTFTSASAMILHKF